MVPEKFVDSPVRRLLHRRAAQQHTHPRRTVDPFELIRPSGVGGAEKPTKLFPAILMKGTVKEKVQKRFIAFAAGALRFNPTADVPATV